MNFIKLHFFLILFSFIFNCEIHAFQLYNRLSNPNEISEDSILNEYKLHSKPNSLFGHNSSSGFPLMPLLESRSAFKQSASSTISNPDDSRWDPYFYPAGVYPYAKVSCVIGNDLYIGGALVLAGNVEVNNIARWDGTVWHALSTGLNSVPTGLISYGKLLIAYGVFDNAGGIKVNHIAKWDGNAWSALGDGLADSIPAVSISNNQLYAADGNKIRKWDGNIWSDFTSNSLGKIDGFVLHGDSVYATIRTSLIGYTETRTVQKWDGKTWSTIDNGLTGKVSDLFLNENKIYAFEESSSDSLGIIRQFLKWNGVSWNSILLPQKWKTNPLQFIREKNDSLYALTWDIEHNYNIIHKWNGNEFVISDSLSCLGDISDFWKFDSKIFGIGNFWKPDHQHANGVAYFEGKNMQLITSNLPVGPDNWVNQIISDGNTLFVRGDDLGSIGNIPTNGICSWDGLKWNTLNAFFRLWRTSFPRLDGAFTQIRLIGSTLYAAGEFDSVGGVQLNNLGRWDGLKWNSVEGGVPGVVLQMECDGTNIFVLRRPDPKVMVDQFGNNPLLWWDGNSWRGIADKNFKKIDLLLIYKNKLTIFGENEIFSNKPTYAFIKSWNGSSWDDLPVNNKLMGVSDFYKVTVYKNEIFVSCKISDAYNGSIQEIKKEEIGLFNSSGTVWNFTPVHGYDLGAIVADSTSLYVGGAFDSIGNVAASCVAKWDGTVWSNLGSGLGNSGDSVLIRVSGLGVYKNYLYLSTYDHSSIATLGGKRFYNLARWSIDGKSSINPFFSKSFTSKSPTYFLSSNSVQSKDFMNSGAQKMNAFDLQGRALWEWNRSQGKPNQNPLGPRLPISKQVQVIKVNP